MKKNDKIPNGMGSGTPLQDAWLVTPSHWQNLLCDSDAGCCPPESLESITDGQLNAGADKGVRKRAIYEKPSPSRLILPLSGDCDYWLNRLMEC